MQVFEYKDGDYSPIVMTKIAEDGVRAISTELPVVFQIHTPYRMPDGTNLCIIVGLANRSDSLSTL